MAKIMKLQTIELLKKDNKKLAKRVADFFGNRTDHRIVITPQKRTTRDWEESEDMAKIMKLQQDPVQRIAGDAQSIDDSLDELIQFLKSKGIDAELLKQQRAKISKEIRKTQNLIESLLGES